MSFECRYAAEVRLALTVNEVFPSDALSAFNVVKKSFSTVVCADAGKDTINELAINTRVTRIIPSHLTFFNDIFISSFLKSPRCARIDLILPAPAVSVNQSRAVFGG
jgi:hypothetical protein